MNASILGFGSRVNNFKFDVNDGTDYLARLKTIGNKFDVIVANPPWVCSKPLG